VLIFSAGHLYLHLFGASEVSFYFRGVLLLNRVRFIRINRVFDQQHYYTFQLLVELVGVD